ncbi:hypothetical protein [Fluviibacterium sp. S390]|uniref:hypothetical protein n=1 Tax=Fluviibacterium sp. S390 TaxID=3415139 RepID=UPI003C7CCCC4
MYRQTDALDPTPQPRAARAVNPVSIIAFNACCCCGLGTLAWLSDWALFSVFALGWFGGAALTLGLLTLLAVRLPDVGIEPAETDPANCDAPSLQDAMAAWDLDRAYEIAQQASMRAWISDLTPDPVSDPHRESVTCA